MARQCGDSPAAAPPRPPAVLVPPLTSLTLYHVLPQVGGVGH